MTLRTNSSEQQGVGLQVRGLRKSYDGCEVLKGLDFEVKPREIFVIIGPSGSCKSVLLKHLNGLEAPDAGVILLDGEPIHSPDNMGRYRVAMVFQSGALFDSMTVAENVGFYLAEVIVNVNRRIHVTSVIVTYDRELAFDIADDIAVINDGRILTIGTPDQIKHSSAPWLQEFLKAMQCFGEYRRVAL